MNVFTSPHMGICAHCGATLDSATHLDEARVGDKPEAGDVSVCVRCAGINVFEDGAGLRLPTPEEMAVFTKDAQVVSTVIAVKSLHDETAGLPKRALEIATKHLTAMILEAGPNSKLGALCIGRMTMMGFTAALNLFGASGGEALINDMRMALAEHRKNQH